MRAGALSLAVVFTLVATGACRGAWSPAAGGSGAARSKTMAASTGSTPAGSVAGHTVTVTWSASQFADGASVPAYTVKRYDAVTSALQATLSACTGLVAATSCAENSVPTGTWRYTVTPAAGAWRGIEGAKSANVVVLL